MWLQHTCKGLKPWTPSRLLPPGSMLGNFRISYGRLQDECRKLLQVCIRQTSVMSAFGCLLQGSGEHQAHSSRGAALQQGLGVVDTLMSSI